MSQIIDITVPSKQLIENTKEVFHVCYEPIFRQETEELQEILQDVNVQRDLKNITIHTLINFYSLATISIVTPEIYIFVESHPSILNEKNSFIKNGQELRAHRTYYKFNIGNTKNLKGLTLDLSNYRYLIDPLNHKLLFNTLNPYDELAKPSEIQKMFEKGYHLVKGLFDGRRKRKLDEKENEQEKENENENESESLESSENESGTESEKFLIDIVNTEQNSDETEESDELIEEQEKKKKRTFQIEKEKENEQEQIEQVQQLLKMSKNNEREKKKELEEEEEQVEEEKKVKEKEQNNKATKEKEKNTREIDFGLLESKLPQNKSLQKSKKKKKRRKSRRNRRKKASPGKM
ncbi:zcchc10 protein [Anaeramoeba flamelloides]|uniref:Zcchc10 protein n=1 Tax=Anaeramoeba flamelloides TaxID=1746091 RepID=A0ABQ8YFK0_9EUKA|nr:zcchc10 protein [Anaeramoeba flamelloides]